MQIATDGIVLKEQPVGENDRLITILTRSDGLVKAFARGAQKLKSKSLAATQMMTYSDFVLYRGRDAMSVDSAETKKVFFNLRNDLEGLSLAQYFCELALALAPENENSEQYLRLLLNGMYLLDKGEKSHQIIKSAVEMRMLSFAGYMPNLIGCRSCGEYEAETMFLCLADGEICCNKCYKYDGRPAVAVNNGVLAALRHTVYAPFEKIFSFDLSEDGRKRLEDASERYLLIRTERNFKALNFYRSIKGE